MFGSKLLFSLLVRYCMVLSYQMLGGQTGGSWGVRDPGDAMGSPRTCLAKNVMYGGQCCPSYTLVCFHHQLKKLRSAAVELPRQTVMQLLRILSTVYL